MSRYTRPKQPGATVFFTVALVDRTSDLLTREVEVLREAVRVTRRKRWFQIDAWVVLPDHLHCVWTLPEGDRDFSGRMGEIKGQFSRMIRRSGPAPTPVAHNPYGALGARQQVGAGPDLRKDEVGIWQKRFGNITFGMPPTTVRMSDTAGAIRSSIDCSTGPKIGHSRPLGRQRTAT